MSHLKHNAGERATSQLSQRADRSSVTLAGVLLYGVHHMTCPACQPRPTEDGSPNNLIVFVGRVCAPCFAKLNRPTIHVGCVPGEPHAVVCQRTAEEFERRRVTLLQQARDICGVE